MTEKQYTSWIQFRVSPEERSQIKAEAASRNLSISAYLRSQALSENSQPTNSEPPAWILKALSSIGNQMNFLQSTIEQGQYPDPGQGARIGCTDIH